MADYRKLQDQQLVHLLQNGSHEAFGEIYKRYWALLYRNARKMLQDDQDATDVVQEVFTLLWERYPVIEVEISLSSYLYSAVRNKIINIINRNKLKNGYAASLQQFLAEGSRVTENEVREREFTIEIEREIANLPDKMRRIFELSRKQHLTYKEIAEEVNVSEGTVKKQVYNALKILRFKLGSYFFLFLMFVFYPFR